MKQDESDLETALKVVAIMQVITEDLDETGRRMWRKMLGQEQMNLKGQKTNKERAAHFETEQTEVNHE
jgi:hypothetical protein